MALEYDQNVKFLLRKRTFGERRPSYIDSLKSSEHNYQSYLFWFTRPLEGGVWGRDPCMQLLYTCIRIR